MKTMRYRRRPDEYDVFIWDGKEVEGFELAEFENGIYLKLGDHLYAEEGDYVFQQDGSWVACEPDLFHKLFEEV
jgi:hypothetical protein